MILAWRWHGVDGFGMVLMALSEVWLGFGMVFGVFVVYFSHDLHINIVLDSFCMAMVRF